MRRPAERRGWSLQNLLLLGTRGLGRLRLLLGLLGPGVVRAQVLEEPAVPAGAGVEDRDPPLGEILPTGAREPDFDRHRAHTIATESRGCNDNPASAGLPGRGVSDKVIR